MTYAVIDYATMYFKLPVINKIHVEHSYELLKKLKKELRITPNQFPLILIGENMVTSVWFSLHKNMEHFTKMSTNTQCTQ